MTSATGDLKEAPLMDYSELRQCAQETVDFLKVDFEEHVSASSSPSRSTAYSTSHPRGRYSHHSTHTHSSSTFVVIGEGRASRSRRRERESEMGVCEALLCIAGAIVVVVSAIASLSLFKDYKDIRSLDKQVKGQVKEHPELESGEGVYSKLYGKVSMETGKLREEKGFKVTGFSLTTAGVALLVSAIPSITRHLLPIGGFVTALGLSVLGYAVCEEPSRRDKAEAVKAIESLLENCEKAGAPKPLELDTVYVDMDEKPGAIKDNNQET